VVWDVMEDILKELGLISKKLVLSPEIFMDKTNFVNHMLSLLVIITLVDNMLLVIV
jgi:hypothetical protein